MNCADDSLSDGVLSGTTNNEYYVKDFIFTVPNFENRFFVQ